MSSVRRVIVIRTTLGRHSSGGASSALMLGVRSSEYGNHIHDANNTPRVQTRHQDRVMTTTQALGIPIVDLRELAALATAALPTSIVVLPTPKSGL